MVKKIILGIIIFLLVIGILRGLFSDSNKTDTQLAYSDLSDFEYEILDNTINLKKYKKHDKKIIINETYNIDGSDYTVTHIEDAIFNGSSANVVYIPKTITCVYDNTLAYLGADHIDLYYAGTQEEWNSIFKEYESPSVKENIEEGNYEDAGKALADKLNSKLGHKYDANKFTYHFQANLEDIK